MRRQGAVAAPPVGARLNGRGRRGDAPAHARDAYAGVPILQQPTWGHDVAAYFYLGGISSGAYVVAALASLGRRPERRALARIAHLVAFATMLPCPWFLIDDLGKPSRFHHMLRIFKPSSPMNLGSWTLTTHGVFATLLAGRAVAEIAEIPGIDALRTAIPERPLAVGGLPTALTLGGYTGVLLGTTSIPVWATSPLLGGLFMASAIGTGAAATTLVAGLTGHDHNENNALLGPLTAAATATELVLLLGYVLTSGKFARHLLRGTEGALLLGTAAGTAAALVADIVGMRASTRDRRLGTLASLLTLVSGACLRWAVIRAGHLSAADREETLAATKPSERAPGWGPWRKKAD